MILLTDMPADILVGLLLYAIVTSITPGPNNLMLLSSGANYGFRRSVPLMLGIEFGFAIMVVIVGVGVIRIFESYPLIHVVMKWASLAYTAYLAWVIAISDSIGESGKITQPLTALQGALFQWVNAKAWVMVLSAISLFAPTFSFVEVGFVALTFVIVGLPSLGVWTQLGVQIKRLLGSQKRLQLFNISMALLLIVSVLPILWT